LGAGCADVTALVERDRAVGEKALHAGAVDDPQKLSSHGIIVGDHDVLGPLVGGACNHFAGDLEGLGMFALGVLHFERHTEALRDGLHALGGGRPVDFVGLSRIYERHGLRTGNRTAQQKGCT
jgi:hypothetical protein